MRIEGVAATSRLDSLFPSSPPPAGPVEVIDLCSSPEKRSPTPTPSTSTPRIGMLRSQLSAAVLDGGVGGGYGKGGGGLGVEVGPSSDLGRLALAGQSNSGRVAIPSTGPRAMANLAHPVGQLVKVHPPNLRFLDAPSRSAARAPLRSAGSFPLVRVADKGKTQSKSTAYELPLPFNGLQ